ncbi:MAG: PilZ domain-containing protein [Myxococcota bacterium]
MGQRGHDRVDANIGVTLTLPDGSTRALDRLKNISLGGLFVEMDEPLPFGSEVGLEFVLPSAARPVRCRGLVVRRQTATPTGVGLRLLEIDPSDMRMVTDFVETHL